MKKEKKEWYYIKGEYCIKEVDMFREGATIIPVEVFMNNTTGEIKTYVFGVVKEKGINYYLDMLNK